jgi:hypothetical protein
MGSAVLAGIVGLLFWGLFSALQIPNPAALFCGCLVALGIGWWLVSVTRRRYERERAQMMGDAAAVMARYAPVQWSPDGRFFWDGARWQPAPASPHPPASAPPPPASPESASHPSAPGGAAPPW